MYERIWIYLLFPGLPILALYLLMKSNVKRRSKARRPFYKLRRFAGYSLQKKVEMQWEAFSEGIVLVMLTATIPAIFYTLGQSLPISLIIGCVACPIAIMLLWRKWEPLQNMRLGLLSEQAVGADLDTLQNGDIRVYHDLVFKMDGREWNIDHVILTPFGLLSVETKGKRMKLIEGSKYSLLKYDGKRITFPDGSYDFSSLNQAERNATTLKGRAHLWTGGETIPVLPILTYPGWTAERTGKGPVYVVSPDKIVQLLTSKSSRLSTKILNILKTNLERKSVIQLEDLKAPEKKHKHHGTRPSKKKKQRLETHVQQG